MRINFMKFNLFFIGLFISYCEIQGQFDIPIGDSLAKYSYTVEALKKMNSLIRVSGGTAFFIKKDTNLFLVTAKHVFFDCDSFTNFKYKRKDSIFIFLGNPLIRLPIPVPIDNNSCSLNGISDTDLYILPVHNKLLEYITPINVSILKTIDLFGNSEIFGQGFIVDSTFIPEKQHHIHLEKKDFKIYLHSSFIGDYIDSINYLIESSDKEVLQNKLAGFSGSPVFILSGDPPNWVLLGVLCGGSNNGEIAKFFILKSEYILNNIKKLELQQ